MPSTAELLDRFRVQLQRNHATAELREGTDEIRPGDRFQDWRGRCAAVVAVSSVAIIYRRDGYDQNCEMRRELFLKEFKKVAA